MSDTRLILAIDVDHLPDQILETGFHPLTDSNTMSILEECDAWFGPRDTLENFDAYRQVIPYVVVVVGDKIVTYTRTPKGGESRLHGKVSFGLGGHIDLPDAQFLDSHFDIAMTVETAAARELSEELDFTGHASIEYRGLLVENATEVDRVHIGIVAVANLLQPPKAAEEEIGEVGLMTVEELMENSDRLENWSKILLPHLNNLLVAEPLMGLDG